MLLPPQPGLPHPPKNITSQKEWANSHLPHGGKKNSCCKGSMSQHGGEEYVGGKYWGKLALGHYTMALGQFTFTGGLVWLVFKFYSRCSADSIFIYFFLFLRWLQVWYSQFRAKCHLIKMSQRRNITWHQQVERPQNGKWSKWTKK